MPSRPGSPYNTAAYRKAKQAFIAAAAPVCTWERCPIPGRIVDKSLSGNHRWGPTIDHRRPTSRGGPMWAGWQLMHRLCNMRKGDRCPEHTDPPPPPGWESRRTELTW